MVEPILDEFRKVVSAITLRAPEIPYISNLTGTWITPEQATDPAYWTKHLRQTVRFADGVSELSKTPQSIFLEVGPGRTLTTLVKAASASASVLPTLKGSESLLNSVAQLWREGVEIDWNRFYADQKRHRVPLPTYPFERQRYWIDPPVRANGNVKTDLFEQATVSPVHSRPAMTAAYAAPRDRFEQQLAQIWGSFLGLEQIGIHDNFFELGGHSLLATQLISRLRDAFQLDLPMSVLFNAPTIEEMALEVARLKSAQPEGEYSSSQFPALVLDREHLYEPFPMTDVQQAYWIGRGASLELGNVATHIYSEAEFEDLDVERLSRAWQRMIRRHDMLRAVVLPSGEQQIL